MKTQQMLVLALAAGLLCQQMGGQDKPRRRATAAEKAATLYTSAMSQYRARQWKQAEELLDKYVKTYATHEYVAVAYLQLAYCREQLKDYAGYEQALNQIIQRFPGSPASFRAYGSKLKRAGATKDHDGYLTQLEAMLRRAPEAPLRLHSGIGGYYYNFDRSEYGRWHFEASGARMADVLGEPGWIMDVAAAADTPARAERALRALTKTIKRRQKELPPDWQYAHAALLEKAGKSEQAKKVFDAYLKEWGDDPRAVGLWLLKIADAEAREDEKALKDLYEYLIKNHAGAGSKNFCFYVSNHHLKIRGGGLTGAFYRRLSRLYEKDRYEEFAELARHYMKTYTSSGRHSRIIDWWMHMARRAAQGGDNSRIASTLEMLDEFAAGKSPAARRSNLYRKIELYVFAKKFAEAAKLAGELLGEKHWSAGSYSHVGKYADKDQAFAKVLEAARARWKIPAPNPSGKAAALLANLKTRLADDQVRHAEEIGEDIFAKYRADAATTEAVKMLADYYFKKVLPEPRDKWMARMVQTWPRHPLTEAVLRNQVIAEKAARRYGRLAAAIDTLTTRFPGTNVDWSLYRTRLSCYDAAKDPAGKLAHVRRHYGHSAGAGEIGALEELAKYELAKYDYDKDNKPIGDYWLAWAGKLAGKRAQLYCLARAWDAYYGRPCYYRGGPERVRRPDARKVIRMLQDQQMDPELRWGMAFADINLLAHCGDAAAAIKALDERLKGAKTYRDLSLRVDFRALGAALGNAGMRRQGLALAAKLRKVCHTRRDAGAIELMLATMYRVREDYAGAAKHYLKIVNGNPFPARMYYYFDQAMRMLGSARSPKYASEIERYIRKIGAVQELVPKLLGRIGGHYLSTGNPAAKSVYAKLKKRYPASAARDKLAKAIEQRRKPSKRR